MKMISKIAMSAFAATLAFGVVAADAKTLKLQASSKAGDWAHRFMTDKCDEAHQHGALFGTSGRSCCEASPRNDVHTLRGARFDD